MRTRARCTHMVAAGAAAFLLALPSQAYYHYVHYLTSRAPYVQVPEAFDLAALPNKTVTFFVSDSGPTIYGPNDSFPAVLSQVKQAAAAWNSVSSSDLRVAFGGLETYNGMPSSTTPGGDVVFQDLAPGVLGLGAPTVVDTAVRSGQNGQFIPILRGVVMLTNTTDPAALAGPGPSYLEAFYTTTVHEFGHALGLQHTWTASAMSQAVIRNTSRARPLDADDIAALSELYGSANWMANTGSISGRVTLGSQGWSMASVVAIPAIGPAVSALTNPDGTYTINGLPPGSYLLYAHPLPPDAIPTNNEGLVLPKDALGHSIAASSGYFQTVFYPGTTDVTRATSFTVAANQSITGKDFSVQKRNSVAVYDMVTWAFLDPATGIYRAVANSVFLSPAYASTNQQWLNFYATPNDPYTDAPLPSSATLLGPGVGAPTIYLDHAYVGLLFPNQGVTPGPHHLVLTFPTSQGPDLYVLPDAINIVQSGPPILSSAASNGDGTVTVTGAGLTPSSRIFFDGLQAAVSTPYSGDAGNGAITVLPPQGASGQNATVTAFTADNQNSMLVEPANPLTYAYAAANAPQIDKVVPSSLPAGFNSAGTAAMVDIWTQNTNLVDGQVTVGFGTSDISVRRVWVLGPTHLVADVVVLNNAAVGGTNVNVISGFQVLSKPNGFQILPPDANLPTPALPVFNALSYATVLHGADYASIFGANLSLIPNGAQVSLNGSSVPVLYSADGQINFQIPPAFPAGPATLQVSNGSVAAFPIYVQIDSQPAQINIPVQEPGAATSSIIGAGVQSVNPGDVVNVQVTGVDPSITNAPGRVQVTLAGVPMTVLGVTPVNATVLQIQFAVTQSFGGWQVPLVVTVDGSPSQAFAITAR